jgi:AraC-like DNA-binding protein
MMRAAKESLISGSQSVTQLAHQLGYSDASAFNRFFLKQAGVTPLQYRKQQLKLSA